MIKDEVLQYLKDNFYIASTSTGLVITNKFTRELGIPSSDTITIIASPTPLAIKTELDFLVGTKAVTTKETYKQFIIDANVPTKIDTSNGAYWANRYSESGFKAFKQVFNDAKINRAILLAATKWYYAQTRTARKMIGTYFSEGIWESCYDDFINARNKEVQTANTLLGKEHIKIPKIVDENASNMEAG